MRKRVFYSSLLLLFIGVFLYQELLIYAFEMGYNQIKIVYNARPLPEVLNDPIVPDSLKKRLLFIQKVKTFAFDSLGLLPSENYTAVYDQQGKPLLWNISACKPFTFEAKRWEFPIAGSFPYKGYFNREKALAEAKALENKGWDVRVRSVGGWSTLGWFNDPILSEMLYRTDGALANLILHELTHSTLYLKDSIEFNENLATFVGDRAAEVFLKNEFGLRDKRYQNYIHREEDSKKLTTHLLNGAEQLTALYSSFHEGLSTEKKLIKKQLLIQNIMASVDTLSFFNKERFSDYPTFMPNNAFFMSFKRYNEKQSLFEHEFKTRFNSNFKAYLTYLKSAYKK